MRANFVGLLVGVVFAGSCLTSILATRRTVAVFRHTFRAPSSSIKCTPGITPAITAYSNYSERPWPNFGTAPQNATVRGLQLTTEFASLLQQKLPSDLTSDSKIQLVYDNNDRDRETAEALARGFEQAGLTKITLQSNVSLFDVTKSGVCESLPAANRTADSKNQLSIVPKPSNYDELIDAMQHILTPNGPSTAEAPPLNSSILEDYYDNATGYWEGSTCLAASFAEVFLFEYGSRILVGWGDVDLDLNSTASNALFRLLENHCYYRSVNMKGPVASAHDHSNMANAMLRVLDGGDGSPDQTPDENIVTIFVGHDADVDQISTLFGTTFQLSPDNQNAVPPMSGIVFTMDSLSRRIQAQYMGALWDPQNATDLVLADVLVVPAYFTKNNQDLYIPISSQSNLVSDMSYRDIRTTVYNKLYTPCVEDLVSSTYEEPVSMGFIAGCIVVAVVLVVALVLIVWRLKRKPKKSQNLGESTMDASLLHT